MQNSTSSHQFQYDLFNPEVLDNPYTIYQRLRDEYPVYWNEQLQGWMITRYADVRTVLYDDRFITISAGEFNFEASPEVRAKMQTISDFLSYWTVSLNPPEHTRLRRLLNQSFKPRLIENLAPRVQAIADELLDAVQYQGKLELMADFAYPLPALVIGEMLGIPARDRMRLKTWSQHIFMFFQKGIIGDAEAITHMHQTIAEMRDYLQAIIADHRHTPQDDIIGSMLTAEDQGQILSDEEIVATCVLLLFAGHETTMNLIGNGTLALLLHPDQYAQLRDNPDLVPAAIDEFLRYDSPAQIVFRVAKDDMTFQGQFIRAGQRVFPVIGAANRDPAQFPDPDRFDISRTPNQHLSFGHGIHFCLGMPLARMEAQIAFTTLLRRCPGMVLATDTITRRGGITLRGPAELPVTFDTVAVAEELRREVLEQLPAQSTLAALAAAAGCPFHRQVK